MIITRLVLKPNCIKVPKEICVEAKVNPRKVSFLSMEYFFVVAEQNPKTEIRIALLGEEASDPGMVLQAL